MLRVLQKKNIGALEESTKTLKTLESKDVLPNINRKGLKMPFLSLMTLTFDL